jgi:hypothetical protein
MTGPEKPTPASIIAAAAPPMRPDPVSPEALWLWDETGQSGWLSRPLSRMGDRDARHQRESRPAIRTTPDRGYRPLPGQDRARPTYEISAAINSAIFFV